MPDEDKNFGGSLVLNLMTSFENSYELFITQ